MENMGAGEYELDLYTIPSYSSWFEWNSIHEVERVSLREFFDGSSITRTPRIYKEYRDFIISKYREEPSRRLAFTHLRKALVGDVTVLHKVFTFLEKWGLINFAAASSSKERGASGVSNAEGDMEDDRWKVRFEEGAPHGVKVVAAPNSLKPLVPLPAPVDGGGEVVECASGFPLLASYSDVYGELLRPQGKDVKCRSCNEVCASRHYRYIKEGSFVLCEKCFKNGNYERDKVTDDFEFSDGVNHDAVWTEAELLLLLESVLKHGDDWELVAQNIKTKSKMDCISKLIQLPFGNLMLGSIHKSRLQYINGDISSMKEGQLASTCSQGTIKADQQHKLHENQQNEGADSEVQPRKRVCRMPTSDASSSLLKQIGHICKAVGPLITASVGEAVVSALCYENQCSREMFDEDDDFGDKSGSSPNNNNHHGSAMPEGNSDGVAELGESEIPAVPPQKNVIPLTLRTRAATATALGAASAHATILANQEEREMEELVATIIEAQLKKMQHKMRCLEDLELLMEKQHVQMEEVEESLIEERTVVMQRLFSVGLCRLKDHALKPQTAGTT